MTTTNDEWGAAVNFNPKWIIGKTVARVEMNAEPAREASADKTLMHSPCITFTDGSRITFTAEESDFGRYGVDIDYWKATT
jgi:hypothetical protein